MNTFLKIFLAVVLVIVAIKLFPIALVLACLLAIGVLLAGCVGLALVAALLGAGLVLAAALSPLWIPALLVVGVIALVRKLGAKNTPAPVAGV